MLPYIFFPTAFNTHTVGQYKGIFIDADEEYSGVGLLSFFIDPQGRIYIRGAQLKMIVGVAAAVGISTIGIES